MSNTVLHLANLEMLRSMYDFSATYTKTLGFKVNDYFILHQTTTKHKNWWEVINERGEMGFIPSNYVESLTVTPSFYKQYIDNILDHVRHNEVSKEFLYSDKKELVTRLKELKRNVDCISPTEMPPLLYKNSEGQLECIVKTNSSGSCNHQKSADKPEYESCLKKNICSKESVKKSVEISQNSECRNEKNGRRKSDSSQHEHIGPTIHAQAVYDLVESVRINTQLSHELSRIAVETVMEGLHELLPASVFPHLSTIITHTRSNISMDDAQIDQTHDASRLKIIFRDLTSCKEDSQQRSWMVYEDEGTITDNLKELISILTNADVSICRHVISTDKYDVVLTLVQYYQMEVRWSIRQLLLQAFGCMCGIDKTILSTMLASILPGELARDMLANQHNITRLNYSCMLLTMLFSMGEVMPVTHLEFLGVHFIRFILNNIENPPHDELDEELVEVFLNFVLSYNLQFKDPQDNIVLKALAERDTAKHFTEKIILLFNREEDPVRIFEHEPAPCHSILKLFIDIFNSKSTANIFYTNDIKVIIDITVRYILDLQSGDPKRHLYIELCRRIVRTTNYHEHLHLRDEILKCFTRIFCEESSQSINDQKLVKEIINEFPQFFK